MEDPSGARDTHSLTIAVDDKNEAPTITSGDTYIYYAENGRGNVAAYRAADPEGRSIGWTLTDTADAEFFTFDRGVLRFKTQPPNYEDKDEYTVEVNAGDGSANNIDSEEVTIEIVNVDEKGTVTLKPQPQQGTVVTATLEDVDNPANDITANWQWARSSSRSGGFTDIQDADGATYTPVEDDTGKYLRATATYTDAHGTGKSAYVVSTNRTQWQATGTPVFRDGADTTREVEENAKAGTNVGAPVAATDIRSTGTQERLTYSLDETTSNDPLNPTELFEIDTRTGQIKVKREAKLDFEVADSSRTYGVTVTARDPSSNQATILVTITVTPMDEPPVLTLPPGGTNRVGVEEVNEVVEGAPIAEFTHNEPDNDDGTDDELRINFVANDPETIPDEANGGNNTILTWTLAGTDADDFEIEDAPPADPDEPGRLRFKETPDYENPTDSGRNNVYEVTVQVSDAAGNMASQRVRITVENVEEDGVITMSHPQPQVGRSLTATLADPDKIRGRVTWEWYRGSYTTISALPTEECDDDAQNPVTRALLDKKRHFAEIHSEWGR